MDSVIRQSALVSLRREWLATRLRAARAVLALVFLGAFPVVVGLWLLLLSRGAGTFVLDFHRELWPGGRAVLDGRSPFPPADAAVLASGANFVFPAPVAYLMAPLALIPAAAADALFAVVLITAGFLMLRVAGVRDWRCYGAAFLSAPMYYGVQNGNLTLLLGLGAALAWRHRDRVAIAGALVGVVVAAKIFLWPLLVWLVATRRYAAAAVAAGTAAAVTAASWAALGLGLGGFVHYLQILRVLAGVFDDQSYTPFALGLELGLPSGAARAIGLCLAALALAACVVAARRGRGDARSFTLALVAALLFSAIVWLHYFALVFVPLAILRPRYSVVWLIPLVAWICPAAFNGVAWQTGAMLLIAAVTFLAAIAERSARAVRLRTGAVERPGPSDIAAASPWLPRIVPQSEGASAWGKRARGAKRKATSGA